MRHEIKDTSGMVLYECDVPENTTNATKYVLDHFLRISRNKSRFPPVLCEADFRGANFSYMDIDFVDLTRADFRGANLGWTNFKDSKLSGANFEDATCFRTKFHSADLSGANFYETDVSGADFLDSDLTGVSLLSMKNLVSSEVMVAITKALTFGLSLEDFNIICHYNLYRMLAKEIIDQGKNK